MTTSWKRFAIVSVPALLLLFNLGFAQTSPRGAVPPSKLMLKNYRPNSLFAVPRETVRKARFDVIDFASDPGISTAGQVAGWVKSMDSSGVEEAVVLTGVSGKKFDSSAAVYSHYPKRFVLFCGLDLSGYNKPGFEKRVLEALGKCKQAGAKGVGELTDISRGLVPGRPYGIHIDDPKMNPILDECAKLEMPVYIRVGQPQWFYESMDSANDGLMAAYRNRFRMGWDLNLNQELSHLAHALANHPRTVFIVYGFGNEVTDLARLGKLFDKYPNLYASTSGAFAQIAAIPRYAKRFIEKYRKRILYGTSLKPGDRSYSVTYTILETTDEHFYEIDLLGYHWPLYGLGLSTTSLKDIYWNNAAEILRIRN